MKLKFFATTAAALALAACGTAEDDTTVVATDQTGTTTTAGTMPMDATDPSTPQGFASAAAATDMFELESARIAQEMSQDEGVRRFAQMMIDDHTTATQNLRTAAGQAQGVIVSPQMTADQQQKLRELRAASADEFDDLYKEQQVAAHEQALELMQNYGQSGDAASLRTFATTTAPIIERHHEMARQLP